VSFWDRFRQRHDVPVEAPSVTPAPVPPPAPAPVPPPLALLQSGSLLRGDVLADARAGLAAETIAARRGLPVAAVCSILERDRVAGARARAVHAQREAEVEVEIRKQRRACGRVVR
jgi:hypothetical protein